MTRVASAIILSAVAAGCLGACRNQPAVADPRADADAIAAVETAMRAAYAARDPARLAALYSSDATIYAPGERPRVGMAAIIKGAQKDMADPAFRLNFTTGKVGVLAPAAGYSKGSFTIRFTDPKTRAATSYSGYYLTLFSKQADGSWKAFEDMVSPAD